MDPITKFLNNISYKFEKGYPDMNDPKDMLIIENELKNIGIELQELEFKPHWKGRVEERGAILDILNFPKNYPISKQEVIKLIEEELIKKTTKLENLEKLPISIPYQVGYKILKPLLNYEGSNIPLNMKVEYTVKDEKKIGTGISFVAVIDNNVLTTLMLLPQDDDATLEISMKHHRKREYQDSKKIKILTSQSYKFIITPEEKTIQSTINIKDLPYKLRTDYRKGEKFEHNTYGKGIIINTSSGVGGKGDSRGRLDWIEVKFEKPYVSGGQLKQTRILNNIYTLTSSNLNT